MVTMTARELNQNVSAAKRAADRAPVVVTDRGEPAYVLMSIAEFRRMSGETTSAEFLERLRLDGDDDLVVEPLELHLDVPEW